MLFLIKVSSSRPQRRGTESVGISRSTSEKPNLPRIVAAARTRHNRPPWREPAAVQQAPEYRGRPSEVPARLLLLIDFFPEFWGVYLAHGWHIPFMSPRTAETTFFWVDRH